MWRVLYIASTEMKAVKLQDILTRNGFLSRIEGKGKDGDAGLLEKRNKKGSYAISVPESEAEEAYEVLCEHGL